MTILRHHKELSLTAKKCSIDSFSRKKKKTQIYIYLKDIKELKYNRKVFQSK